MDLTTGSTLFYQQSTFNPPPTHNCFTALLILSGTTRVSWHQKSKTNLDLLEQESEWQWHQLGHMQIFGSRSRQITMPVPHHSSFLQARCPSCHPTNKYNQVLNRYHVSSYVTALLVHRVTEV